MTREEGIRPSRDPDRDGEHHRVERLGDEQVGDSLDVRDDPAALRDDARHVGEAPVEQHHLRDRAGRRGAAAHRDADVGVFQSEGVVHPVARHRDHVSAVL